MNGFWQQTFGHADGGLDNITEGRLQVFGYFNPFTPE